MLSSSKVSLDRKRIEEIIKGAFGEAERVLSVEENHDGWFNALYAVSREGGEDVFLKVAPRDETPCLGYERGIMKTEIEVLKLFNEREGIPVPAVLFADERREILDTDYFIMEKLPGNSLGSLKEGLGEEDRSGLDREKGRISREINRIKGKGFGQFSPDSKDFGSWKEAFLFLTDLILDDALAYEAPLPLEADRFREIFRDRADCLEAVTTPSLVHWDLHDGNVLVADDRTISGIIDCDRALWGDPAMEFYFSELFPESEDFHRGYGRDLRKKPGFSERRALYDLYLTIIFVTECRSRQITDKDHLAWADSMLAKQMGKMGYSSL